MKTTKLLQDFEKCLTCRLKDVRVDGIYCTCGRDMGWRCSYYAESEIKLAWSRKAGRVTCEVYRDLGAFYVVRVAGAVASVGLWVDVVDAVGGYCKRIGEDLKRAGLVISEDEADLVVEMLDQCKCL